VTDKQNSAYDLIRSLPEDGNLFGVMEHVLESHDHEYRRTGEPHHDYLMLEYAIRMHLNEIFGEEFAATAIGFMNEEQLLFLSTIILEAICSQAVTGRNPMAATMFLQREPE
jgi:hypothetical protein